MKFQDVDKPRDSRFTEFVGQRQYEAFRTAYLAKVRPHLEAKLIRLQASKKRKTSAVTNNQRLYAAANANILKNGATKAQCELVKTVLAKLAKSEVKKTAAEDHLESHQSGIEDKLLGKTIRRLWNEFQILKWSPRAMKRRRLLLFGSWTNGSNQRMTSGETRSREDQIAIKNG